MQTEDYRIIDGRYEIRGPAETYNGIELSAGHDLTLDRPVLVQRLAPEVARDPERSRTFLRRQQLASSIHDCPLLTVYDAGISGGSPYSIMEQRAERTPGQLFRPGYPPDVPAALRATKQIAEALRCCREAGLDDWAFSPRAVSIDRAGNAQLAVIEGLGGPGASARPEDDVRALAGVMLLALTGKERIAKGETELALIPVSVRNLLARMLSGSDPALRTASDVESAIVALEQSAYQPTQAYVPVEAGKAPVVPPVEAQHASLAPTLPVALPPGAGDDAAEEAVAGAPATMQAEKETQAYDVLPYTTPEREIQVATGAAQPPRRTLLAIAGVVLLVLLLALLVPRLLANRPGGEAAAAAPATTSAARSVQVPALAGKTLDQARESAGVAGVNLAVSDPVYDPSIPSDMVARQVPDPSTAVQAGSLVTVSLSLGPEAPAPTTSSAQTQQAPSAASQGGGGKVPPGQQKKDNGKKKDH